MVTDRSGQKWRVRRVWFTRSTRWRGPARPGRAWDVADGLDVAGMIGEAPGIGAAIAIAITAIIVIVLAVFFVLPALALAVELLIILLIAAGALVARVVLRRPWLVVAQRVGSEEAVLYQVVGYRASGRKVADLAQRIERGDTPTAADD